jgi:hypothetical protein
VIDGLTGVQRVLFGWAQVRRTKSREAEAVRLATDPHRRRSSAATVSSATSTRSTTRSTSVSTMRVPGTATARAYLELKAPRRPCATAGFRSGPSDAVGQLPLARIARAVGFAGFARRSG